LSDTEWRVFLSCEHGGNRIPPAHQELFRRHQQLLATHRGYDIGILPFARRLARELGVPLHVATVSRLLVDMNRSPANPRLYSEITRRLPRSVKEEILAKNYYPYRQAVIALAENIVARGERALHFSLHSFTPELGEEVRRADVGLLYDPARQLEKSFCLSLQQALVAKDEELQVRRNYPYRGKADGLVVALRRRLPEDRYLGIEIEFNQAFPLRRPQAWHRLQQTFIAALRQTLAAAEDL